MASTSPADVTSTSLVDFKLLKVLLYISSLFTLPHHLKEFFFFLFYLAWMNKWLATLVHSPNPKEVLHFEFFIIFKIVLFTSIGIRNYCLSTLLMKRFVSLRLILSLELFCPIIKETHTFTCSIQIHIAPIWWYKDFLKILTSPPPYTQIITCLSGWSLGGSQAITYFPAA